MKNIKIAIVVFGVLFPLVCNAVEGGLYRAVNITSVGVQDALTDKKYFWVTLSSDPIVHPVYEIASCHVGPKNRVIWDLDDVASRAALSLALTAYTTGKKIDIDAYGTCIDGMSTVRNTYFIPNQ